MLGGCLKPCRGLAAGGFQGAVAQAGGAAPPRWSPRTARAHVGARQQGSLGIAQAAAAGSWPVPPTSSASPAASPNSQFSPDTSNLPPLPSVSKGLRLPPTAPITWTFMISYLLFMLVIPIIALLSKASTTPLGVFMERALEPVAMHAYFVSFSCALAAAVINAVFGFLLAWVLVKYEFPGKKWIDAAVDLPFALPTSVAGLTLATVYSDEAILGRLLESMGISVVFTRLGVALAMVFVSFPFVVRTMQPVIQEMQVELEEAAWTLGASPWKTFTDVLLPPLLPPLLTGTALAFSRALGEFGSIVIISSNFAFKDLIAPVLIFQCLEQYDFMGATVIGTVLLAISLVIMLLVNWIQSFGDRFRN
mmetsp:Transcript_21/g.47  ORF Transcript_21/g.47 Transcript_21/m.47 type:complete len:364 (-) Transcript_21:405-1496(-)|eukprot:CAMPEP_0202348984 /NCGR_PEP_ID=MMETSP1126-20121109/6670_1 /ASSEMBLY_ACC=CAM_ASM_000457 /TAXON_ID=3047 /ORGANISM="Dunaliella tertiolecta, Strain CCMP1320" /LENGTH=363 /DNA_ID=CAMNT_0048940729 /DNA_START=848 /DNA_END=1939 /DNA_ORIENTATION=+